MKTIRRAGALLLSLALLPTGLAANANATTTATTATLPACQHFYTGPIPSRTPSAGTGPSPEISPVNISGRLPAPGGVSGGLNANGTVTFTFNRVTGAQAYRAFRNGQALQWIDDWGQPTLTVTDSTPCQNANYQLYAMADKAGSEPALGQISTAYRIDATNHLAPFRIPVGTTLTNYMVTSYNDGGQTALGYNAGPGFCAVDARNIPWGTKFYVPGYGHCFAADIGSWIKDSIVDVWLPGVQANNWGVQVRTLVVEG